MTFLRLAPLLAALALSGCKHVPTEKEQRGAQIHYDLGVQVQTTDPQAAFSEYEEALKLDPDFPEAHNAIAVLLHMSFRRPDEAVDHYKRALELRPGFSEAKTNLANVYLDQKRYDEAIPLYEAALNDMLYREPYTAQNNLGWALYKKGEVRAGIDAIKAAVTTNPKFCQGHRNLGLIYEEQGNTDESCKSFARYREACPDVADAHYREGVCLAKVGDATSAKRAFDNCQLKAKAENLKDDCKRLSEQLGP